MNTLWQTPAVVLSLIAWLTAPPASLGELAQREALRRQAAPKSRAVLTNLGLPVEAPPPSAVTLPPPEPTVTSPPVADPDKPQPEKPSPDKPEPVKDEQWWRTRMAEARAAVEQGQQMAQAIQTRINKLQADAVNLDDPIAQARARQDLNAAIAELAAVNKRIAADRDAITALQEEARRLNVPPGWIR